MALDEKYQLRQITSADPKSHKSKVRFATDVALPAYTNSAPGELTASANGAFPTTDGVVPALGDSVLLTSAGSAADADNGIYTITQLGDGSNPWVLTRRSDANADDLMPSGVEFRVDEGALYGGKKFYLSTPDPIVVDTTALTFTAISGGGSGASDTWEYDPSTAEAAPGNGFFRLNNADPTLATEIYLGFENQDGVGLAGVLGRLRQGDVVHLFDPDDPTIFVLYSVTYPASVPGAYVKAEISSIDSNGSLVTGTPIAIRTFVTTDDGYAVTNLASTDVVTVPADRAMIVGDDFSPGDGELRVEGDVRSTSDPENHTISYVNPRQTRVVHTNEVMNYDADNLVIDGNLIVDGDIVPMITTGTDVLNALTDVAPDTPSILGASSPVSFLSPAAARTVMDVYSTSEVDAVAGGLLDGLASQNETTASFTGVVGTMHIALGTSGGTITLPAGTADLQVIGVVTRDVISVQTTAPDNLILTGRSLISPATPTQIGTANARVLHYFVYVVSATGWVGLGAEPTQALAGIPNVVFGTDSSGNIAALPSVDTLNWNPTLQASGFTAVANTAYRYDGAFTGTIDLPASPADGDEVILVEAGNSGGPVGTQTIDGNGKNLIWPGAGSGAGDLSFAVRCRGLAFHWKYSSDSDDWHLITTGSDAMMAESTGTVSMIYNGGGALNRVNVTSTNSAIVRQNAGMTAVAVGTGGMIGRVGTGTLGALTPANVDHNLVANGVTAVDGSTGTITNWTPTSATTWRQAVHVEWNGASDSQLHGIHQDPTLSDFVYSKVIHNDGLAILNLVHNSGTEATVNNRIFCPSATDYALRPDQSIQIVWHRNISRWVVLGNNNPQHLPFNTTSLSANQNDWVLDERHDVQRIDCTVASTVTGIVAPFAITSLTMQQRKLINVGTANITLSHEDVLSTAANRFLNYTGADIVLAPNDAIDILYDPTSVRWRVGV